MHKIAPVLAILLLAGCAGPDTTAGEDLDSTGATPTAGLMVIQGRVFTLDVQPLANVTVAILGGNQTAVTDPSGAFAFEPLPSQVYSVQASLDGYYNATLSATPGNGGDLSFFLERSTKLATDEKVRYKGHLDCSAEYLIIPGDCDRVLEEQGISVTNGTSIFEHGLGSDWKTVVVDVTYESASDATFDGLRITVKGKNDADVLTDYEQYGRFHGTGDFTFRIDAGEEYTDGTRPVPANATALLFDVFPQGHAYHQACDPSGQTCFLGVGAAVNLDFELVVTTFYVEPAPEGYSLL